MIGARHRGLHRARITVTAVACCIALAGAACSNDEQREAEERARRAAEQAETAVEKARDTAEDAARQAGDLADQAKVVAADAKQTALKGAAVAAQAGAEAAVVAGAAAQTGAVKAAGLLRTGAIKAALLADKSLDVSDVDVDTDEPRRHVVLTGQARSAAQKAAIERVAAAKAPGYTIENRLTVR